jgi:DNA end-binding protein Ku
MWKGEIKINGRRLPVRLFAAIEDQVIHFRLLHDQDLTPLYQQMVNPRSHKTIPLQESRKAYEVNEGTYALIDEDDLKQVEPEESRDIEVLCVVKSRSVEPQWYDRPYYLGPDDEDGDYFAWAEALEQNDLTCLVKWTMRRKQYFGALQSEGGYLRLITLRHNTEVIPIGSLSLPKGKLFSSKERQMSRQLVEVMAGPFEAKAYHNEYRHKLMEFLEARSKGKFFKLEEPEEKEETKSLADSLKASLNAVR